VDPQLLIVAGIATLAAGALVLLSFGPRYRVGRLLAATPEVDLARAIELASADRPTYVRVRGRIDSDAEFEDTAHRPLVFRRTRIEIRRGRRWRTVDEQRERVPFRLDAGLDSLAIDAEALGPGLVVVPREAVGRAADVADRIPPGTPPDAPARAIVELVSSVEHAIVTGSPAIGPDGSAVLTAGLGRPLVLTTLEVDEAMRVLAGGDRRRPFVAAVLLVAGAALVAVGLVLGLAGAIGLAGAVALAADPTATPGSGGDPRGPGEGPGFVGEPLAAIAVVLGIGVLAVVLTLAYVRLTARPRD
jgi:hypothetical protein